MKPLLVGESNPYGSDPRYALYPAPENSAGGRLCRLVMGLGIRDYISRFDRANLCAGPWRIREARARALELLAERKVGAFVLLGAKVQSAFGFTFAENVVDDSGPRTFVFLPHPSGLSRSWNVPGAYELARSTLQRAGVL